MAKEMSEFGVFKKINIGRLSMKTTKKGAAHFFL